MYYSHATALAKANAAVRGAVTESVYSAVVKAAAVKKIEQRVSLAPTALGERWSNDKQYIRCLGRSVSMLNLLASGLEGAAIQKENTRYRCIRR